jgi:hypothetical protein
MNKRLIIIISLVLVASFVIGSNIVSIIPAYGKYSHVVPIVCIVNDTSVAFQTEIWAYYREENASLADWHLLSNVLNKSVYFWNIGGLPDQDVTIRCIVNGENYTNPYNISISTTDTYIFINPFADTQKNPYIPWFARIVCDIQQDTNVSLYAMMADCQSDGVYDYIWMLNFTGNDISFGTKTERRAFECINFITGSYAMTGSCILQKDENTSWGNICGITDDNNLCQKKFYMSYEVTER